MQKTTQTTSHPTKVNLWFTNLTLAHVVRLQWLTKHLQSWPCFQQVAADKCPSHPESQLLSCTLHLHSISHVETFSSLAAMSCGLP